ncbi:MAG: hypothetical protein N4A37_08050 [Prolixibacteraceae bacterium]|nr:hypothetical protein [Prolixibacteraceae bacterium]
MVPPWFLHGLSIDLGVFDGGTMEQPWTNHGGTTFKTTIFLQVIIFDLCVVVLMFIPFGMKSLLYL